jgi:sigma-B regulation protein RsbU (phosphoserine phosphatase)
VLYTDGVIEAINNSSEEYGQTRLLDVIKSCHGGKAQEVINAVMADIRQFTKELPQHDDITIIAFKINSRADHEHVSMAESSGTDLQNNQVSGGFS